VVWYYRYPTAESALVAGRLSFYNEKVDVFVDGVKEEKCLRCNAEGQQILSSGFGTLHSPLLQV
jgi:hypothetical protein